MKVEIIAIGTELLLGRIVNTNAAYLGRRLSGLGIDVYYHTTVGDNPQRLTDSLQKASLRSDIVILTGGLGPTVDDITTETVAKFIGSRLILNKRILKDLKDYFKLRKTRFPSDNTKQAYIPEGIKWIRNRVGTAPGLICDYMDKIIICLPGPPRELEPMFENDIIPYLKKRFRSSGVFKTRTIRIAGLPESLVNNAVKDLLKLPPPTTVGIYAKLSEVDLVIMAKAHNAKAADCAITALEKKIRSRFRENIFGYDEETLEGAVGRLLAAKGVTLAAAESCTGGLMSNRITDVSGSSQYFKAGIAAYSNEAKESFLGVKRDLLKKFGAVSATVAIEMARGIKHYACSDIGLGITGIAGPTGASSSKPVGLVFIALVTDKKRIVKEFRFRGSRQDIKFQASQAALDLVRRNIAYIHCNRGLRRN